MTHPILRSSSRLTLREWRTDECEGLHRWLGDPTVQTYLTWGSASLEETASHLADILAQQASPERTQYYLAIELNSTGVTIGDTGFTWIDHEIAEIGYFLEPDYWGQGYATEAARLVMALAFALGARTVVATCDARNTASERVMQRCGMTQVTSDTPGRLVYNVVRSD